MAPNVGVSQPQCFLTFDASGWGLDSPESCLALDLLLFSS